MQRPGLSALENPNWKEAGAGFQLGSFPVVHCRGLALAGHLMVQGLTRTFQTGRYPELNRQEELS